MCTNNCVKKIMKILILIQKKENTELKKIQYIKLGGASARLLIAILLAGGQSAGQDAAFSRCTATESRCRRSAVS
jgi:hypothetical protein